MVLGESLRKITEFEYLICKKADCSLFSQHPNYLIFGPFNSFRTVYYEKPPEQSQFIFEHAPRRYFLNRSRSWDI